MPDRTGAESETRNSGRAVLGNNPKLLFRTVADNLAEANRLFDMMHGDRYAEAVHNDHKHNPAMLKGIDTYIQTQSLAGSEAGAQAITQQKQCVQYGGEAHSKGAAGANGHQEG